MDKKQIEAFLTDRFAEAIRQACPELEDKSFEWAKPFVDECIRFIFN